MEASVIGQAPVGRLADDRRYKYVVLFFLYVSQSIPAVFFVMAFPVLLRQEGQSLNYIGYLNLLLLPVILKILWAPLVDSIGSYKGWIIPMQLACIAIMITIGFFDWVEDFWIVYALCFLYTVASSTQDIGVDGLAVRALDHHERPVGNGISVAGQYLGSIIGGGAMIMLFNKLGMTVNLAIIVAVLAIPLLLLIPYREPVLAVEKRIRPNLRAIPAVFRKPGMKIWMAALFAFNFAPMLGGTLVRPLLVDRKVSLETIGFMFGIMSPILAIAGCALAPLLINRLGRKKSLMLFTFVGLLQIASDAMLLNGMIGMKTIYACVAFLGFTGGFAGILAYAIIMDKSEAGSAGTDFSVQVTLVLISLMMSGIIAGFLGQAIGYRNLFIVAASLQLIVLLAIARFVQPKHLDRRADLPVAEPVPQAVV